jgi:hypothetical protein
MGEDPSEIREEIEETRRPHGRHRRGDRLQDRRQVARRGQGVRVDSVRSKIGGAGSRVNEATPGTEDVKQSAGKAAGGAQENPIGLALGSLAIGFSERHAHAVHQRGGREARRGLRPGQDTVKETAQEAADRGKQVAQGAAQSATDTAQESGQRHVEELQQTAQQRAEETRQTAGS